jgi:hypothetical protein
MRGTKFEDLNIQWRFEAWKMTTKYQWEDKRNPSKKNRGRKNWTIQIEIQGYSIFSWVDRVWLVFDILLFRKYFIESKSYVQQSDLIQFIFLILFVLVFYFSSFRQLYPIASTSTPWVRRGPYSPPGQTPLDWRKDALAGVDGAPDCHRAWRNRSHHRGAR